MKTKYKNLLPLKELLERAEHDRYAVGAFSPRSTAMIRPVLLAAEGTRSPLIVQIAQPELERFHIPLSVFAQSFFDEIDDLSLSVPVGLHLDHTRRFETIQEAIACGFTSVMIDASAHDLADNIAITREVVAYAHARDVSVEGELGRIGTADFMETEKDEELYTRPEEAQIFARETGVDALAVSVGTAHGVYKVRQPKVDLERLKAIRALTHVHLVLHGGSGTPVEMVRAAVQLAGGGVSKINIATDLELAMLAGMGREGHIQYAEMKELPAREIERGRAAVQAVVMEKIIDYLGSQGMAG